LVKLRLRRTGRKKLPLYKIVAADARSPRDGRVIEELGTYNPKQNPVKIELKEERVFYWLNNGAQPTDTVRTLLSRKGVMLKLHLKKKGADEQKINEEYSKWSSMQEQKVLRINERRTARKLRKKKTKSAEKKTETPPAQEAAPPAVSG
jgi:small subunit ribosomal protein S16